MTTTTIFRRAATPVRAWIPCTLVPGVITLGFALASRGAVDEEAEGVYMALALTFLTITCIVGPLMCVAWRAREMERRFEDELSDALFRLARAEADNKAVSQAVEALSRQVLRIPDHVPPEWR